MCFSKLLSSIIGVRNDVVHMRGDIYGRTPFIYAAWHGTLDMVKMLLESGSDVGCVDDHKYTALHYAAANNNHNHAVLLYLINIAPHLIDVQNVVGFTPLYCAARCGSTECVEVFQQ